MWTCVKSLQSCLILCDPFVTVALQTPLFMEFPRQEYGSGLPFPSPGDLSDPGIEAASLGSPALTGRFFTTSTTWEAPTCCLVWPKISKIKMKGLNLTELVICDNMNKYFN